MDHGLAFTLGALVGIAAAAVAAAGWIVANRRLWPA